MLLACFAAAAVGGVGIWKLIGRSSIGVDELISIALCVAVIYFAFKGIRAMYTPKLRLTSKAILVRRWKGHRIYPYERMEALATYGEVHAPTVANASRPEKPMVVDHLLIRASGRVYWLVLPGNGEEILASVESRTGLEIHELEDRRQAKQWAKG